VWISWRSIGEWDTTPVRQRLEIVKPIRAPDAHVPRQPVPTENLWVQKFDLRTSLNIKISKHFLAASTPSPKGMPFSQPDSDSPVVLLNKFDQQ
jgi:hypothetical protein